jgi:rubredoxin/uncharacterized membrane protein
MMKQWKCTVCGYVHVGEEPPEKCPICGADRSEFIELPMDENHTDSSAAPAMAEKAGVDKGAEGWMQTVLSQMVKHHVHPISVHIPNGLLPVSVIFVVIAILLNHPGLYTAAFYNMVVVVITLPLVIFSGINEWRRKYQAKRSNIFITKMVCSAVVTLTAVSAVVWRIINPEAATDGTGYRWLLLGLHLVMLAAAAVAGYIGGKLVFKD